MEHVFVEHIEKKAIVLVFISFVRRVVLKSDRCILPTTKLRHEFAYRVELTE